MLRLISLLLLAAASIPLSAQPLPSPTRPLPTPFDRPLPHDQVVYVDATRGNDSADGSRAAPLRTVAKAVSLAKTGDTICLRGGVYYERVAITTSGTDDKPITLRSFPGELATLD